MFTAGWTLFPVYQQLTVICCPLCYCFGCHWILAGNLCSVSNTKEAELVEMLCCLPVFHNVGFAIGFDADGTYYSSVELGGVRPYKGSLYVQLYTHTTTSGLVLALDSTFHNFTMVL